MSGRTATSSRRAGSITDGDKKAWASGRVLTTEQRLRKQEVDRKANRFLKKEVQDRLALLEARVLQLEASSTSDPPKSSITGGKQDDIANDSASSTVSEQSPHPSLAGASDSNPYWTGQTANLSMAVPSAFGPTDHQKSAEAQAGTLPSANYSNIAGPALSAASIGDHNFDSDNVAVFNPSQVFMHPQLMDVFPAGKPSAGGRDLTMFLNHLVRHIRNIDPDRVCYDDQFNQDVIISAVLKGWKYALSKYEQVCPLWEVLRMVDLCLFKDCNLVERISCLRMLHKRYMFETKNVPVQVEGPLPAWFQPHMTESLIAHEPVIDHLTWPRLRERLMGLNTDILSNKFWTFFARNLRVAWQYEPLDVLTFSPKSCLYQLSSHFEGGILDMANWRMDVNFFYEFPGLADDIPPANYMPLRQMTPRFGLAQNLFAQQQQQLQQRRRATFAVEGTPRLEQVEEGTPLYDRGRESAAPQSWNGFYA